MEAHGLIRGIDRRDSLNACFLPLFSTQRGSPAVRMARFPIHFGAADGSGCNYDELNQAIATRRCPWGKGRFIEVRPTPWTEAS